MDKDISLIGVCSGWGATNMGTAHGPKQLIHALSNKSPFAPPLHFTSKVLEFHLWENFDSFYPLKGEAQEERFQNVLNTISIVAQEVYEDLINHRFPIILGGDHSIAIGTWTAVRSWLNQDFGLIWIDAHLDAHTFATSPSAAIHGMPVAALLGHGPSDLTHLCGFAPKIKPENIAFIGIRSFEEGEAELIKSLGIKVFDMEYIDTHGFDTTFKTAKKWVTRECKHYGITFDIDALDPSDAPGTGTREPNGIRATDCLPSLKGLIDDPHLLAFELMEYNSLLDQEQKTEMLIWNILQHLSWRKT